MLNTCLLSELRSSRWLARLIGAPPETEGIRALLANPIVKESASRSERGESSRGPKKSLKVSRETVSAPKMYVDA